MLYLSPLQRRHLLIFLNFARFNHSLCLTHLSMKRRTQPRASCAPSWWAVSTAPALLPSNRPNTFATTTRLHGNSDRKLRSRSPRLRWSIIRREVACSSAGTIRRRRQSSTIFFGFKICRSSGRTSIRPCRRPDSDTSLCQWTALILIASNSNYKRFNETHHNVKVH